MREILFRGKRVIDGKWVESCCPLGEMHSGTITHDFISETVCQYTGLTDKNGMRIFEGDIIKHDMSNTIGTVKWYRGAYTGWYVNDNRFGKQQFMDKMFDECEVIGNFFDNPDLINE